MGTFSGCRGASIYGHQIIPDVNTENNSTVFYEIYDLDSTVHWFVHLYDGEIWCYYHNRYEMVKKSVRR